MQLIDRSGFVDDPWHHWNSDDLDGAEVPGDGDIIVEHRQLRAALAEPRNGRTGVHIENDASAQSLVKSLAKLDLISIAFPATGDGRGFSLARQLRNMGFQGELRASGPLIVDQFAFTLACGFDTIEIPKELAARQPETQWQAAIGEIKPNFQNGYPSGIDVLAQRHGGLS